MHNPAHMLLAGTLQGRMPLAEFSSQAYLANRIFSPRWSESSFASLTAVRVITPTLSITVGGSTTISTGVGSVRMSTANAATNASWIPITYAGVVYFIPAWTTNAP